MAGSVIQGLQGVGDRRLVILTELFFYSLEDMTPELPYFLQKVFFNPRLSRIF